MKRTDFFWMTNDEWWDIKDGHYVLTDNAPEEAKTSFANYSRQIEDGDGDDLD